MYEKFDRDLHAAKNHHEDTRVFGVWMFFRTLRGQSTEYMNAYNQTMAIDA